MNPSPLKISIRLRLVAAATCVAFLVGCATRPQTARGPEYGPAASMMAEARPSSVPVEKRPADHLQAAAMSAPLLCAATQEKPERHPYNAACGEHTALLRTNEGGH